MRWIICVDCSKNRLLLTNLLGLLGLSFNNLTNKPRIQLEALLQKQRHNIVKTNVKLT